MKTIEFTAKNVEEYGRIILTEEGTKFCKVFYDEGGAEEVLDSVKWITTRKPEDLQEVYITFINTDPEPYYENIRNVPQTGCAVYYRGDWFWWSSVTVDVLAEYGRCVGEEIDPAIQIIAWREMPKPMGVE